MKTVKSLKEGKRMNATSRPAFGMAVKLTPEANAAIKQLPGKQVKRILQRLTDIHNESNKVDCDAFISLAKATKKKEENPTQRVITKVVSALDADIPGITSEFKLKKIGGFWGGGFSNTVLNDISVQADKQADLVKIAKFQTT